MRWRCGRPARTGAALAAACAGVAGPAAWGQLPAFPGADGAGGLVSGGRGGIVYRVTRLDSRVGDNGPGTLQYGVADANFRDAGGNVIPRTIVFDVGGTIWLGRNATDRQGWDTTNRISVGSNVTIAGHTAPGGITIAGGQVQINGTGGTAPVANVIFRNVTLAPGYGTRRANSVSGYYDTYVYDAMNINSRGVMVSHVSAVFATDETISCNERAADATVQYSSMSQGQNYPQADAQAGGAYKGHAMGSLWSPGSDARMTLHHNLYAHQASRLPAVQTSTSVLTKDANGNWLVPFTDVRNNVVYNWLGNAGSGSSSQPANINLVGNYYRVGAGGDTATGNAMDFSIVQAAGGTTPFSGGAATTVFHSGNVRLNLNGTTTALVNANLGSSTTFQTSPNPVPYRGFTDTAQQAFEQVLSYAGANWQNRSSIDTRIFGEARNGTGKILALNNESNGYTSAGTYATGQTDTEWNRLLALRSTTNGGTGGTGAYLRPAGWDTDADGMPDAWERARGLDPATPNNNGTSARNGYTDLEEYLNELGAWPAGRPLEFSNAAGTGRFAEVGNWATGVWRPSRFDTARVTNASAVVDVAGMQAGAVQISLGTDTTGTLTISDGWLFAAGAVTVGDAGRGTLAVTGGYLRAATSVVLGTNGGTGTLLLTGGSLSTPLLRGTTQVAGGILRAGRVEGNLTIASGTLAPGGDAILTAIAAAGMPDLSGRVPAAEPLTADTRVTGDLTLLSPAMLALQLASPTSFDTLTVDGTLTLGGTLSLETLGNYAPPVGTEWPVATARSIDGALAGVTGGFGWRAAGGMLFVSVIPEPVLTAPLLASGLLAGRRIRRR